MPWTETSVKRNFKEKMTQLNQAFLACMNRFGISEETSRNMIHHLKELNDMTEELFQTEPPHNLPHLVTQEEYQNLMTKYQECIRQIEPLNQQLQDRTKTVSKQDRPDLISLQNRMNLFTEMLYSDYDQLSKASALKEPKPMALIVYESRTPVYTGNMNEARNVSGHQSTRKVITITNRSGERVTGLFTEKHRIPGNLFSTTRSIAKGSLKLESNARLDQRSSAMSTVAELLGRDDLLAKATPMNMMLGGKTVEGTFMEMAAGMDFNTLLPDNPYFQTNIRTYRSPSAIKDMMDLGILDYLCMNVDRHPGNMIYQYRKDESGTTKLVGIKGIDNDSSFGTLVPHKCIDCLPAPENLCYISSGMANKIRALTPEMLRFALHPYGLTKKELDAACGRLQQIQNMLETGKDLSKKLKNTLADHSEGKKLTRQEYDVICNNPRKNSTPDHPMLIEIPEDHMNIVGLYALDKIEVTDFEEEQGIFAMVNEVHREDRKKELQADAKKRRNKNIQRMQQADPHFRKAQMTGQLMAEICHQEAESLLADDRNIYRSWRGTSDEFTAVESSLQNYLSLTAELKSDGHEIRPQEVNELSEMFRSIEQTCSTYLQKKERQKAEGARIGSYTQSRIDFVQKVKDTIASRRLEVQKYADTETLRQNLAAAKQIAELSRNLGKSPAAPENSRSSRNSLIC